MVILRFYSQDGILQPIAKYINEGKDPGTEKIKDLCRPVVYGLAKVDDPVSVMNARITDLDKNVVKSGFDRLPLIDEVDHDKQCDASYDVVLDSDTLTATVLTFAIEEFELPGGGMDIRKAPRGKEVIGQFKF